MCTDVAGHKVELCVCVIWTHICNERHAVVRTVDCTSATLYFQDLEIYTHIALIGMDHVNCVFYYPYFEKCEQLQGCSCMFVGLWVCACS